MLCEMGEYGEKHYPGVARRVRYAADAQGLWYARSDVMAILASTHGETIAREQVARDVVSFCGTRLGGSVALADYVFSHDVFSLRQRRRAIACNHNKPRRRKHACPARGAPCS